MTEQSKAAMDIAEALAWDQSRLERKNATPDTKCACWRDMLCDAHTLLAANIAKQLDAFAAQAVDRYLDEHCKPHNEAAKALVDSIVPDIDDAEDYGAAVQSIEGALARAAAQAVAAAVGDIIKEGTCVQPIGDAGYVRGWDEAMRFVEGVAKAIRARGAK